MVTAAQPNLVAGFFDGLKQPSLTIDIQLQRASLAAADLTLLARRLRQYFEIDPDEESVRACAQLNDLPAPAQHLCQATLLLARELLQLSHIPVLALGRALGIQQDDRQAETLRIVVRMPIVEQLPMLCFQQAYRFGLKLALLMADPARQDRDLLALAETVLSDFIEPTRRYVQGGSTTVPVMKALSAANIPWRAVGPGIYRAGWGRHNTLVNRSTSVRDSAIGVTLCRNKVQTAQVLRTAGLPAPVHQLVGNLEQARQVAAQLGWPVVVKPADSERGEGVTINIRSLDALERGFATARERSSQVLVERQVEGHGYRLLVADGRLQYAVRKYPKHLIGDGTHTVAELMALRTAEDAEKLPWKRMKPWLQGEMEQEMLAAAGLNFDSVVANGERVLLRPFPSNDLGGSAENVLHEIHPDNIAIALRAVEQLGLECGGVDFIGPDIDQPWYETGLIINEVNFAPQINASQDSVGGYLPAFIGRLLPAEGRVPVEVYLASAEGWQAAHYRQACLYRQGVRCYMTTADQSWQPDGATLPLDRAGLNARIQALLSFSDLDTLIIGVENDEWLHSGLGIDQIDQLHLPAHPQLVDCQTQQPLKDARLDALLAQIKHYCHSGDR